MRAIVSTFSTGRRLSLALLLSPSLVLAQTGSTPVVVPPATELAPRPLPRSDEPAALPPASTPRELARPDDERRIDVSGFSVDESAPPELRGALAALTAPYVGPQRSFEDLQNAAAEVARYLQRELGYYLGYAYIPEQTSVDGKVRIGILEGRLDEIQLRWSSELPVRREVVEAYLARLQPGDILRVRELERVIFLINDLRGITARFEVQAGSRPGTARLVVTPQAESLRAAKIEADLNGSRFFGEARLAGLTQWNSPLGVGDGLTANALITSTAAMAFGLLSYTRPIGADGLKLGGGLSVVRYQLKEDEFPLGLSGTALSANGYAVYPLIRSRNSNLFGIGSLEYKAYTDKQAVAGTSIKKNTSNLVLGATGDFRDSLLGGAVNTYELQLTAGQLRYEGGFTAGNLDAPDYQKATASYTRLQNLLTNRALLYLSLRGQAAFQNLDTTEQFRVGGPEGVRAFAPGEGTGDSGAIATLELRWLPPESLFGRIGRESVVALFADWGTVTFRREPSPALQTGQLANRARLGGAGLGWTWVRPGQFALRTTLATPLEGVARNDKKERDPRVYAQFTKFFD